MNCFTYVQQVSFHLEGTRGLSVLWYKLSILNRCDFFNGAIIIMCRCDELLILGYRYAQGVDSKVGQKIYVLGSVVLMKFMPNEQIPIRNI